MGWGEVREERPVSAGLSERSAMTLKHLVDREIHDVEADLADALEEGDWPPQKVTDLINRRRKLLDAMDELRNTRWGYGG